MNNYKSTKGLRGILLINGEDTVFRVYDKNKNFKDYEIFLSDIEITINDEDAFLYNDEYIDYSKETLGAHEE